MKSAKAHADAVGSSSKERQRRQARRFAVSAAVVAKAHYLAAVDEASVKPSAVARLRARWLDLEARKHVLQGVSPGTESVRPALPSQGTSYRLF